MPPRTVVVNPTTPGPSLTFELPTTFGFDVQSVLANIDATAAGDTVAEIVVADVSGAVIATKRQSSPIPAGDAGSATWALRLDDDGAAADAPLVFNWLLGLSGAGLGNDATALMSGTLDARTAVALTVNDSAEVAWTVAAGNRLFLTAFNFSPVQMIFDVVQVTVQRIDAVGASHYSGPSVFVNPGATVPLSVGPLVFGPAQLNIAVPNAPTVVAAGRYAVGACIAIRPTP